ncbi:hypothetical protein [Phaeovulum sp.]|uniref:hypothetical protein n=1 Tax=Phaeovulum sp. TaxID=2934796 RepID=UPI0039E64747
MTLIRQHLRSFHRAEDGAVTVDWVVLTAAVVALGMIAGGFIWSGTGATTSKIASFIKTQEVMSSF